jgi:hypothetical protein
MATNPEARMKFKRDRIARDVVLAASIERAVVTAGARVVSASGEGNGDSAGRRVHPHAVCDKRPTILA